MFNYLFVKNYIELKKINTNKEKFLSPNLRYVTTLKIYL